VFYVVEPANVFLQRSSREVTTIYFKNQNNLKQTLTTTENTEGVYPLSLGSFKTG
jgi:hypothetical protein